MLIVLGITNTLSTALQQKDQDIVNGINCVRAIKSRLDELRRKDWDKLLAEVYAFCDKHDIAKLEIGEAYADPKNVRKKTGITNKHHFQVECFNDVIDWLLQELDSRFNETTSQLLVCLASLNPRDKFHNFNIERLSSLAKLYPSDFDSNDLRELDHILSLYITDVRGDERFSNLQTIDVRGDERFSNLQTIAELSRKMVETNKHQCYPLVYHLVKLVLVLPVATATVERIFLAMKLVKMYLRNRIGDEYMSNSLICYVEKQEMEKVTNDIVFCRLKAMAKLKC
jgi:hypothetical protein